MIDLKFTKQENGFFASEFDSPGRFVMQMTRKDAGGVTIYERLDGMPEMVHKAYTRYEKDVDVLLRVDIPKGMKVKVVSTSEVLQCRLLEVATVNKILAEMRKSGQMAG